jgi:2-polyprenyl-3-methyl-5-hydroxy-6-metoxy-1,4-benzoquinol methylase
MLRRLEISAGASILDVACGAGWTTAFLAESGYRPTGVDLVPAHVDLARIRASRWGLEARFEVADMDDFDLQREFDAVLMLDALHRSTRQAQVVANVARHLRSGGSALFGEPSWLHALSPGARSVSRQTGWTERGVTSYGLRRDLRAAGFGTVRRFFGPTQPYESRVAGFLWQLVRLVAAYVAVAPKAEIWIAARKD